MINKENSNYTIMTYNEKKSLYESIMKDVAKTVKRQINEADWINANDIISKEDALKIASSETDKNYVFKDHLNYFGKTIINNDSSRIIQASMTIIDILAKIANKKDDDLIIDIARIMQLYNSGYITADDIASFVANKSFKR